MVQFSKDTLEKINSARMEGLYHEVGAAAFTLLLQVHCQGRQGLSSSALVLEG